MLVIDIILIVILLGSAVNGWRMGLIKTFAGLIGIFIGFIAASMFSPGLADWLTPILDGKANLAQVIAFAAILFIVNGIIGLGAFFLDRFFKIFSFIPFVKTINHLGGFILGLFTTVFILGVLIVWLDAFPIAEPINEYIDESKIVPYMQIITSYLLSFFPTLTEQVKNKLTEYGSKM